MTTDNIFSTGMKTSVFQFAELKAVIITLRQARKQLNKKHMNKAALELWCKGQQATWFDKKKHLNLFSGEI